MAEPINPRFLEGPVPGMSLTTEPGNRPWENPPQLVTVQEAADFYSQRLLDPEVEQDVATALDQGLSVSVIVEQVVTSAVMEGYHTIDVATLIAPVVKEIIMYIGDINEIDYVESYAENQKKERVPLKLAKEIAKEVVSEPAMPEEDTEEERPVPRGLMSKRSAL